MRIIDKYLLTQWAATFFRVVIALVLIIVGTQSSQILSQQSFGTIKASQMLWLVLLKIPTSLELIIPAAMMVSVITVLRRMGQDQEIIVMQSAGIGSDYLVKQVCFWSIPVVVFSLISNLWLTPWSFQKTEQISNSSNVDFTSGLVAKTFMPFLNSGQIYIEEINDGIYKDIIIDQLQTKKNLYIVAKTGEIIEGLEKNWLVLYEGHYYQNMLDFDKNFIQSKFDRLEISFNYQNKLQLGNRLFSDYPTQLFNSNDSEAHALLQWRIFIPISIFVLALWGLQFSKLKPRTTGAIKIFLALVLFIIFYNISYYLRVWSGLGTIPIYWSVWLSPVIFAVPLFWLLSPKKGLT